MAEVEFPQMQTDRRWPFLSAILIIVRQKKPILELG